MPRSPVCVDANIVVALVTAETSSQKALALWTEWMTSEIEPVAPRLLHYEVTSVMRRKVVRGSMQLEDASRSLREALAPEGVTERLIEGLPGSAGILPAGSRRSQDLPPAARAASAPKRNERSVTPSGACT